MTKRITYTAIRADGKTRHTGPKEPIAYRVKFPMGGDNFRIVETESLDWAEYIVAEAQALGVDASFTPIMGWIVRSEINVTEPVQKIYRIVSNDVEISVDYTDKELAEDVALQMTRAGIAARVVKRQPMRELPASPASPASPAKRDALSHLNRDWHRARVVFLCDSCIDDLARPHRNTADALHQDEYATCSRCGKQDKNPAYKGE